MPHQANIPPSDATVSVSIIDTTSRAHNYPCQNFFSPQYPGLETLDVICYAFLITHGDRHMLFDLGVRKDWENLVPTTVDRLRDSGAEIKTEKDLVDILRDGGVDLTKIEAAVWSHTHWDHTGKPSSLLSSTKLLVGPGFKKAYMPGYPTNEKATFQEADIAGREVVGIEDSDFNLNIGDFKAHDYFGDGSFFLLSAPGHALGQLNALARTSTNPDTFIFLAADSVHFGGELRPSRHLPLPETVIFPGLIPNPCPREQLLKFHPRHSPTEPYLGVNPKFPEDQEAAESTKRNIQDFDADDRVLVVFTHDMSMYDILEFFPSTADEWHTKGWKAAGYWAFLPVLQGKSTKSFEESASGSAQDK